MVAEFVGYHVRCQAVQLIDKIETALFFYLSTTQASALLATRFSHKKKT